MIIKGTQRGGHDELARHLMKPENEHVELHEVRGFVSNSVAGAFREAYAISRGTKCRQFLFSVSMNPPPNECVPVAAFEDAADRIEQKLGLTGQPRVLLFHEKNGRRHAHCVWSRIDGDRMKAINLAYTRLKLQDVSRELYIQHGWKMPEGMIDPALRSPLNFDRREWFQAKRTGQDPRDIKAAFQQCWAASDSGKAFGHALEQRGYFLARGDRRAVVAVDVHGEIYAVARMANVKTKAVVARMGGDLENLPSVAQTKVRIAELVREKLTGFVASVTDEFAKAAQATETKRLAVAERHRADRKALQASQDERWTRDAIERSARFRQGLRGLWDRVTGRHSKLRDQNERETQVAERRDRDEKQGLINRQLEERQRLQREIQTARQACTRHLIRLHREMRLNESFRQPHEAEISQKPSKRHMHLRL